MKQQKVKCARYGVVFVTNADEAHAKKVHSDSKDWEIGKVLQSTSPDIVGLVAGQERRRPEHCELCGRKVKLTKHHLIPKSRIKGKKPVKVNGKKIKDPLAMFCEPCHDKVHSIFGEKELQQTYNTVNKLKAHPEIAAFIEWVKDRRIEVTPSKKKKRSK